MISSGKISKVVVDIGNGRIKAILGELSVQDNSVKVIKYVDVKSMGMVKNEIRDTEALAKSIKKAINELSEYTNKEIESVTIGIGGESVKSRTINVEIEFSEDEITQEHIKELIKKAEKNILKEDEQLLKTEIYNVRIDSSGIVKNPIGLVGSKMQADVHLIFTEKQRVIKLVETINRVGLDVDAILLNSYASAKAILDDEDKRMGVALVDIGEGSTDIILYKNDKIIYVETIPLGGMHFKSDLVYILKLNDEEIACEILDKFRAKDITPEGYIYYDEIKHISAKELDDFISARVDEMIEYIGSTIEKSGFDGYLGKGLVLTGGVIGDKLINTEKLLEKINQKTGYVARKVLPISFNGLENVNSTMATVVGLFYEVMEEEDRKIRAGEYKVVDENIEEEQEEPKIEELEEEKSSLEEVFPKNEEEKDKKGVMKAVKEWFSNFI